MYFSKKFELNFIRRLLGHGKIFEPCNCELTIVMFIDPDFRVDSLEPYKTQKSLSYQVERTLFKRVLVQGHFKGLLIDPMHNSLLLREDDSLYSVLKDRADAPTVFGMVATPETSEIAQLIVRLFCEQMEYFEFPLGIFSGLSLRINNETITIDL